MATMPIGVNVSGAVISKEDNEWIITEYPKKKDGEVKTYNLSRILESFEDTDGINLTISGKTELPPDAVSFGSDDE